jgi:bacterioferritin
LDFGPRPDKEEQAMSEVHRQKASKELLDMMNRAIARELQVSIQYMWQHIQWVGVKGFTVRDQLKLTAINEMTHAELIADRLNYLGGVPTTTPDEIKVGQDLKEMIMYDVKAEEEAVAMYKKIIDMCREENDIVTRKLFEQVLEDEENHLDMFEGWLGDL